MSRGISDGIRQEITVGTKARTEGIRQSALWTETSTKLEDRRQEKGASIYNLSRATGPAWGGYKAELERTIMLLKRSLNNDLMFPYHKSNVYIYSVTEIPSNP